MVEFINRFVQNGNTKRQFGPILIATLEITAQEITNDARHTSSSAHESHKCKVNPLITDLVTNAVDNSPK